MCWSLSHFLLIYLEKVLSSIIFFTFRCRIQWSAVALELCWVKCLLCSNVNSVHLIAFTISGCAADSINMSLYIQGQSSIWFPVDSRNSYQLPPHIQSFIKNKISISSIQTDQWIRNCCAGSYKGYQIVKKWLIFIKNVIKPHERSQYTTFHCYQMVN